MTGDKNRRPLFINYGSFTKLAGGDTDKVETARWNAWAELKIPSVSTFLAQAQELQSFDFTVLVNYDGRFNSQTVMVYEGVKYKCESFKYLPNEGFRNEIELRYSKVGQWVDIS